MADGDEKTILIVDDDQEIRRLVRAFLSTRPRLRCLEAADGIEAVEALLQGAVDLVILDLNMPRMNGLEVASFIRRNPATADVAIVMFTTEQDAHTRRKAMVQGINDYLTKPFNAREFQRVIDPLLSI